MFNPEEYIIFEGFSGSHLYGTATEESDVDTRGVVVPPMDVLIDPFNEFNVKDSFESGDDRALYSLKAFFKLCADNNPNVLELLFVPSDKTMFKSARWDYIQKNRRLFLSKNIKHRFLGYAVSQLKKIERHREWFINPPSHKPTRKEFGLKEHSLVPDTVMQNVFGISQDLFIKEYRDEFAAERNYREAKRNWDNYYKWQKERNPKRRGSEERYGYDTKCASHLFRLMYEGKELLLTGDLKFPLAIADELLEIKNGKYTFEEVCSEAARMEKDFDMWYEKSRLRNSPNRNKLTELYYDIVS